MEPMTKKRKYKRPFSAAMDYYIRMNAMTNKELGLAVGYSNDQMIQAIRTERSRGGETSRRKIAEYFGLELDDFRKEGQKIINGNATLPTIQLTATASEKPGNVLKIDQEHANVIRLFQNKKLALEINHMLVEIEKDNPDKLWKIRNMLDTVFMPEKKDIKKRG